MWLLNFIYTSGRYSERFSRQESELGELKGVVKVFNDHGSNYSILKFDELSKITGKLEARVDRIENDTRHIEVIESEHRRLTTDVEKLKDERTRK